MSELRYYVSVNGKPARETGGLPVTEDAMKLAVMDIQMGLMKRNHSRAAAIYVDNHENGVTSFAVMDGGLTCVGIITVCVAK